MNSLGENIKTLRRQNNLSQQALADIVGVTKGSICQWEGNRSTPSGANMEALSNALNVKVADLYREDVVEKLNTSLLCEPETVHYHEPSAFNTNNRRMFRKNTLLGQAVEADNNHTDEYKSGMLSAIESISNVLHRETMHFSPARTMDEANEHIEHLYDRIDDLEQTLLFVVAQLAEA